MLDIFISQNPAGTPGFLLFSWNVVGFRGKQIYMQNLLSPVSLATVPDFPLSAFCLSPPPPTTGTAWRDNPSQGGRGQRWKQAGTWGPLRDKLPLGRLCKRVRHPGSACACKWLVFRDVASQLGDLCVRSAALTPHGVKFLAGSTENWRGLYDFLRIKQTPSHSAWPVQSAKA